MRKTYTLPLIFIFIYFYACTVKRTDSGAQNQPIVKSALINPALPGDNPDPSVIRIGNVYYATSTTNEWAPCFTIYKSTDLKTWTLINHVFPEGSKDMKAAWGENKFWASELSYDARQNKIYAYYTAHKKNVSGNAGLQCGVAWIDADKIETGKFTDNGPIIVEKDCGAIDAFELIDKGKIYTFWKNDGNGCGQETWIWMQEMNESRTKLIGEKKRLFTASQPWENKLVEGACFFKKGKYYYSLYAVGGCCDSLCNYKTGIARTKDLASGKWEKYEKNPVMVGNDNWKCPGHGTVVETPDGKLYMLYHAFNKDYNVFVGREGVIEEMVMSEDGWPLLHNSTIANRPVADMNFHDDFTKDARLSLVWQWPSKITKPGYKFDDGLKLESSDGNHKMGTFLGQYMKTTNLFIEAEITIGKPQTGICLGGAIFGSKWPGELGGIGITAAENGLVIFNNLEKTYKIIKQDPTPLSGNVKLAMKINNKVSQIEFYQSLNDSWIKIYETSFNASKYTPWGMGYRIGIVTLGKNDEYGIYKSFEVTNLEPVLSR
ncbi:glycoside hydrolase family 43 protein [Pedobacter mucosus]|uniref:glycoside hydrolase family 43 protein n=1 Tax=Pedobacter mucosus TaxID=2895286 RepID=UPI001EE4B358|nr:glycoside hydrolase family 43 protein [Pedobacter mucosus]UKT65946.1 glycoside hydrolase family 43 protein [Pedobacter mucosus]